MELVKNNIKKFLLSRWTPRILYFSLGFFVGIFITYLYIEWDSGVHLVDVLKASSPAAILLSVMLASRQFVYNGEWNKKDAANKALYTAQKNIGKYMDNLGLYCDVRQKMRNKKIICLKDIHNAMGVFVKNGTNQEGKETYKFVYNGSNVKDIEIKNIHTKKDSGYSMEFNHNIDGRKIERTLLSLLNEYEYICLSTRKDIFDRETIIELIGPSIGATFYTFQNYIMHLRVDGRHGKNRSTLYKEIEEMYYTIKEYKNNIYNLKEIKLDKLDEKEITKRHKVPFRLKEDDH